MNLTLQNEEKAFGTKYLLQHAAIKRHTDIHFNFYNVALFQCSFTEKTRNKAEYGTVRSIEKYYSDKAMLMEFTDP